MPAPEPLALEDITTLYRSHHGWLRGWLWRRLGCPSQAADLAQDTFIRLLGRTGIALGGEPRAYLATIARGLVIDLQRRAAIERAYLEALAALPAPLQPSLEERAIVLEALAAIDAMLDGLKPAVRQAFLLSQLEGLTYAEIADELKVSVRTVNNYMVQALERCYLALP